MTSVNLLRGGGLASIAFGALVAASAIIRLAAGDPVVAAWLGFTGTTFGVLGLMGLSVPLGRAGSAGLMALGIAILGLALSLGQLYGLTFNAPRTGPLGELFPLGYGPFLFGLLAIDLLIVRTAALPRTAAALMILGAALNAAGFATVEVRLIGVVVFGVGVAWLGAALSRMDAVGSWTAEAATQA